MAPAAFSYIYIFFFSVATGRRPRLTKEINVFFILFLFFFYFFLLLSHQLLLTKLRESGAALEPWALVTASRLSFCSSFFFRSHRHTRTDAITLDSFHPEFSDAFFFFFFSQYRNPSFFFLFYSLLPWPWSVSCFFFFWKKVPLFGCVRVFVAAAMATGDTFTHTRHSNTHRQRNSSRVRMPIKSWLQSNHLSKKKQKTEKWKDEGGREIKQISKR